METKKTTAKATAEAATPAKPKRKRREPRGWYIDKNGRIPLDEYFKDEPEPTGPGRMDMLRKKHPDLFTLEILDMRAVLK